MTSAEMQALAAEFHAWTESTLVGDVDEAAQFASLVSARFTEGQGRLAYGWFAGRMSAPVPSAPTPDLLVRMAGAVASMLAERGYFDGNIADIAAEDVCEAVLEALHSVLVPPALSEQR